MFTYLANNKWCVYHLKQTCRSWAKSRQVRQKKVSMRISEFEKARVDEAIRKLATIAVRNFPPKQREDMKNELIQQMWCILLEREEEWLSDGVLNGKTQVLPEVVRVLRNEIANQKKKAIHGINSTAQTPRKNQIKEFADENINKAKAKARSTADEHQTGKYSTSFIRSKRFPTDLDIHEIFVSDGIPNLTKEQKGIVDLLIQDFSKQERPKAKDEKYIAEAQRVGLKNPEFSQRKWVITESDVTKEKYINTKKVVKEYYSNEYNISPAKPYYASASGLSETKHTSSLANIPHQSCASSLKGHPTTSTTKTNKNNLSDSESHLTTNGERTSKFVAEKPTKSKIHNTELLLINDSGIVGMFRSLRDVEAFLNAISAKAGKQFWELRYQHKHTRKQNQDGFRKPENADALFVDNDAGCCGKIGVQFLCHEGRRWSWYCWSCGEKGNTSICYVDYDNTLEGFLLSLFHRGKSGAEKLIELANRHFNGEL
mgnify:CR=1 FL=1